MNGLTELLAQYVAQRDRPAMPPEAASIVRSGFIDTIATMIAGRDEPVVDIVREFVAQRSTTISDEATLMFGTERASSVDAALINGTAAHALDYDDVALGGHPSTVLVPAILAEAERISASGTEAMNAYLIGYEIWAELFSRESDSYHLKGWHPTGVLGTVGAAASVAYLNRLEPEQCRNALAIAASMASGLVANFGTMTKPLHAGRAAAAAIEAVRFAVAGLTASADALEHPAGFLAAISANGNVDRTSSTDQIGKKLRILEHGLSIKKYPACYATHRVIDGVLDLANANDLDIADITEIRASVGTAQASMLRNHAPTTGLEAKFSLEFAVASALVARKVGLSELTDGFVNEPLIRTTMEKVRITTNSDICPLDAAFALHDRVEVELKGGRVLDSGDIRFARGHGKLPLANTELQTKFLDCTAGATDIDTSRLYRKLDALERVSNIRALTVATPMTPLSA